MGDLGHVRYESKVGHDSWRLAKVVVAKPDSDGKVRTVEVEFRPRHVRDIPKPYITKPPVRMTIGVQRFAVLLPMEEQIAQQGKAQEEPNLPTDLDTVPPQPTEMS